MKIECPNCKLVGQTSDMNIPPEGRYLDCPRCKTSFHVTKAPTANWADTLTDCPECGFTSYCAERFDICPNCGLVAKEYRARQKRQLPSSLKDEGSAGGEAVIDREQMRRELERLEREEEKKRLERVGSVAPAPPEEPVPEARAVPAPIRYLGWGFVLAGLLVVTYGLKGWYDYWVMTPEQAAAGQIDEPPGAFSLFLTHGLAPLMQVLLGIGGAAAGTAFAKMRPGAGKLLETAAWCGVAYVVAGEAASLVSWVRRSSDSASLVYYLIGFADSVLMAALWSAPLLAAIWYMRRDVITDEFRE